MGLIRKSLMVGTGGIVSGSSKKQKVAKATMRAAQQTARNTAKANKFHASSANSLHQANLHSGAVNFYGDRNGGVQLGAGSQPAAPALAPLPAGLVLSPDGRHVLIENEWKPFARNHLGAMYYNGQGWVTL